MPTISSITDDVLVAAIASAQRRVVLVAPGVWPPVATAIAQAWRRLGGDHVTVVLDVDPEICRIGYGSLEGLKILQEAAQSAGEALGQESGVRICVLLVDEQTLVFSPTPRQLEAPPGSNSAGGAPQPKANGIILGKPPADLERELGAGPDGLSDRNVGLETLDNEKLESVSKDLEANPPKSFDLARAVSVYNAHVQFVEFALEGCRLSEHRAQLPDHLIKVLKRNPALSMKIGKTIKLIDEKDDLIAGSELSQETLFRHRDRIQNQFLRPVSGVGTVIARSQKAAFSKDVEALSGEVKSFASAVEANLAAKFQATAEEIADEILDEVMADLPERWKKTLGSHPDSRRVRWYILEDLLKAFGTPAGKVGRMKVSTVFKDVTYDMLKEPHFRAEIARHFPNLPPMEEFSAAKERPSSAPSD